MKFNLNPSTVATAAMLLQEQCHGAAAAAGWWTSPVSGEAVTDSPYCFSNKLMLIVNEVAEAMEGDRKGLMDDKLTHRTMREVELADAAIRIFDLAGAYGMDLGGAIAEKLLCMDLGGAIAEKLLFNAQRADHKIENRASDGGKKY